MTTTEEKIVQYLTEARAMELALVRTLQAHVAMTPSGDYRTSLERHLRETRGHADRIARRLSDLGERPTVVEAVYGVGQQLVGQLLALGKAPLDMVRGASPAEKLLKNAKDECATEALEIATYDALEQLALRAGDEPTARLATEHRADEERMLRTLREQLPALTAAVLSAEVDGRRSAAADDGAGGAGATAEREQRQAPFAGYDDQNAERVVRALGGLTPAQLRHVERYERAHKRRRTVLEAVERKAASERGSRAPAGAR